MTASQPGDRAATVVPPDQVAAHLASLWRQLDTGTSGTPPSKGPGLQWQMALSPALPTTWPPTATTVWVRYTYAHGFDPALRDGARVARPWAQVSLPAGGGPATVVQLATRLTTDPQHDTQGVRPLDTATAGVLRTADEVLAICLRLTALPAATSPETASLRAYYRAWLANNGAIAAQITPAHGPFIAWVHA